MNILEIFYAKAVVLCDMVGNTLCPQNMNDFNKDYPGWY